MTGKEKEYCRFSLRDMSIRDTLKKKVCVGKPGADGERTAIGMKKKRKSIMVLGTGPVLFMTVVFIILFICLLTAYAMLRNRDPGTAAAALFFGIAAGVAAILLMAAYFRHKREDAEREARWAELDKKEQKHS